MLGLIILVIVSLLPFVTTWITSPQEIFIIDGEQKKKKEIFKKRTSWKLTKKGLVFLFVAAVTIFLAFYQYEDNLRDKKDFRKQLAIRDSINRDEIRIRDQQSRRELQIRDSLYNEKSSARDSLANVKVEQGKNETILALAKYSLRYDSAQKRIEKLVRDSSKTKLVIQADPVLQLCLDNSISFLDSIANKGSRFQINICNLDAPSSNHQIYYYVGYSPTLDSVNYRFLFKDMILARESILYSGQQTSAFFTVNNNYNTGLIVILIKGTYTSIDGSKKFSINTLYYYNILTKTYGFLKGNTENEIKQFLKKFE